MTPKQALTRGAVAAVLGTAAMDGLWFYRYRRGGGTSDPLTWEFAIGLDNWDGASAPGKLGKQIFERVTGRPLGPRWAGLTTDVMHWGYGVGWGALYGVAVAARRWPFASGLPYGALVWGSSYVILPLAGVYKQIWEYDVHTLWQDLSAHLVYGLFTGVAFALLGRGARRRSGWS